MTVKVIFHVSTNQHAHAHMHACTHTHTCARAQWFSVCI